LVFGSGIAQKIKFKASMLTFQDAMNNFHEVLHHDDANKMPRGEKNVWWHLYSCPGQLYCGMCGPHTEQLLSCIGKHTVCIQERCPNQCINGQPLSIGRHLRPNRSH